MECVICGKEIKKGVLGRARSNGKYCSDECREEGKRIYASNYAKTRRTTDDEWRDRRRSEANEYQKAYRERLKAKKVDEHAHVLSGMNDVDDIKNYLNENFRVRMS